MIGFLLFLVSICLLVPLFMPLTIFTIVLLAIRGRMKELNDWFFKLAISVDQFGNVAGSELFNIIWRTKASKHKFGNPDETISSVIGKNKVDDTLTWCGELLNLILELFERDHSVKAIEEDE